MNLHVPLLVQEISPQSALRKPKILQNPHSPQKKPSTYHHSGGSVNVGEARTSSQDPPLGYEML